MNLNESSVRQLATAIRQGDLAFQDCIDHFASVTKQLNPDINAFREFKFPTSPPAQSGPLAGIPIGIKDGICTENFKTAASSSMLAEYQAPYNASVIESLNAAGALCVGKTNMDEFAMGSSTENSFFGNTRNPWDQNRVPGGSSGGSAAAVAAGMVPLALGSDTGGSIRQPAAFCGITGLKPTYGLVSRLGLIAFASSLDQIGPMGRSAEDVAIMLNAIAGHDRDDSTSASYTPPDYTQSLEQDLNGIRVGVCKNELDDHVEPSVRNAVAQSIEVLKDLGAQIVDVELPHEKYAVAAYYIVAPCEASSNLSRYDGVRYTARSDSNQLADMYTKTRSQNFGPEVKRRILLGTYALSSGYYDQYYIKGSKVRRLIKQDFEKAFETVDLIAGPTTPTTAFEMGAKTTDPIQMYLADVFTVSANLAGIPAISIPCGFADGLPIGMQLQSPAFHESQLLNVAHRFQTATDWHLRRPNI